MQTFLGVEDVIMELLAEKIRKKQMNPAGPRCLEAIFNFQIWKLKLRDTQLFA